MEDFRPGTRFCPRVSSTGSCHTLVWHLKRIAGGGLLDSRLVQVHTGRLRMVRARSTISSELPKSARVGQGAPTLWLTSHEPVVETKSLYCWPDVQNVLLKEGRSAAAPDECRRRPIRRHGACFGGPKLSLYAQCTL